MQAEGEDKSGSENGSGHFPHLPGFSLYFGWSHVISGSYCKPAEIIDFFRAFPAMPDWQGIKMGRSI
jgi:hypothetical protein